MPKKIESTDKPTQPVEVPEAVPITHVPPVNDDGFNV